MQKISNGEQDTSMMYMRKNSKIIQSVKSSPVRRKRIGGLYAGA